MKVLVAEDDATLREEVTELLRNDGHTVQAVADGDEALRCIEAEAFDLALVDWNMPGTTGGQVLRRAREIRPRTAVIVMTGYGNVETAVEALRSGAKDFLQKPFDVASLEKTIQSIRDELAAGRQVALGGGVAARPRKPASTSAEPSLLTAAFLHSKHGLLMASKVRAGMKTSDQDLLVATLTIIQDFMRVSFPMLEGKELRSISQGDLTLVTETGRYLFLTAVVRGEDTPALREEMRTVLRDFEDQNHELLAEWDGIMEGPAGAEAVLQRLLDRKSLTSSVR